MGGAVFDCPDLRDRRQVFRDRSHAGDVLAGLLAGRDARAGLVLAIPAGGVPVGAIVARRLEVPLDLAVVSKITPSWNTEVGYGAVAWDGTTRIDRNFVRSFDLSDQEVQAGVARAQDKVARRLQRFRGDRPPPVLAGVAALLVDDGLASGSTLRVAVEAARGAGASAVLVAVPTGHSASIEEMAAQVDVYCANLRGGVRFAVADAYQLWTDLTEDEVAAMLSAT